MKKQHENVCSQKAMASEAFLRHDFRVSSCPQVHILPLFRLLGLFSGKCLPHLKRIAFQCLLVVAFLWMLAGAATCQSPSVSNSLEPSDLLRRARRYFESFVSFRCDFESQFYVPKNRSKDWDLLRSSKGRFERLGRQIQRFEQMLTRPPGANGRVTARSVNEFSVGDDSEIEVIRDFTGSKYLNLTNLSERSFTGSSHVSSTMYEDKAYDDFVSDRLSMYTILTGISEGTNVLDTFERHPELMKVKVTESDGIEYYVLQLENGSQKVELGLAPSLGWSLVYYDSESTCEELETNIGRMYRESGIIRTSRRIERKVVPSNRSIVSFVLTVRNEAKVGPPSELRCTTSLTNIESPISSLSPPSDPPPEGVLVRWQQHQHIPLEWREGGVVRYYDKKAVESIRKQAKSPIPFRSALHWNWFTVCLFVAGCSCAAGICYWKFHTMRRRSARINFIMFSLLAPGAFSFCHASSPIERNCGIMSMYVAITSFGYDDPIEPLLEPEYVSSFRGRSVADLQRLSKKLGFERAGTHPDNPALRPSEL